MFETIKCSIVIIRLKTLVAICESIKLKMFKINASNIPWDDFYSFFPFQRHHRVKSNLKDFIASFFDLVPIARLKRKKKEKNA